MRYRFLTNASAKPDKPVITHRDDPIFIQEFEEIAENYATRPALYAETSYPYNDGSPSTLLTYAELNRNANYIRHYLQNESLLPQSKIGLYLYEPYYTQAVLGVWKAAMAFIPITTGLSISPNQLYEIIEDSRPSLIITQRALYYRYIIGVIRTRNPDIRVIFIEDVLELGTSNEAFNLNIQYNASHLAYIIYSSGSTGKPKGIKIPQRGLYYAMKSHITLMDINDKTRIALYADNGFDASLMERIQGLGAGACLYAVPSHIRHNPRKLSQFYIENELDIAIFTPSMLIQLNPHDFPHLKYIISTGEKLSYETYKKWSKSGRNFINGYGPSEYTIVTSLGILEDLRRKRGENKRRRRAYKGL